MKKLKIAALITLLAAGVVPAAVLGPFALRVERFESSPDEGYFAPFYLYTPAALSNDKDRPVVLLVQPNNSGTNSDDPEVHEKDAWWMTFGRHGLADDLAVALLVPAFVRPATDWRIYTHALDRDVLTTEREDLARLDIQLLAMIDAAADSLRRQGHQVDERVLLQGYSASGMFANRFTLLHPERVLAVAAGSPGGWPVAPHEQVDDVALPYPAGVADLEELVGRPFDAEMWRSVPQLLVMGALDENDSLDFNDGWDRPHAAIVDSHFGTTPLERWPAAERLYREAGAQAEFLLVEGVGHDRRALQKHTTKFFERILTKDPPHEGEKRTVVYKTVDGLDLDLDVYPLEGPGPHPALLWLHGGALIFGGRELVSEDVVEWCRKERVVLSECGLPPGSRVEGGRDPRRRPRRSCVGAHRRA